MNHMRAPFTCLPIDVHWTIKATILKDHEPNNHLQTAERDIIAIGLAVAAIIMLVGTGGSVLPKVLDALFGNGTRPDVLLVNALLLNIALIIFGWRRYRELTREIEERRRAEARAQMLAATDPLTQCLNRRSMIEATEALRATAAERGELQRGCRKKTRTEIEEEDTPA